jgi:hypothetical protein
LRFERLLGTVLICKVSPLASAPLARIGIAAALASLGGFGAATAAPIVLTIKNHRFAPAQVSAPPAQRLTFQVHNGDPTPEEFESYDLKIEKIVVGGGTITVNVGPQKPGAYAFFGDYNPDSAKGVLHVVAK